MSEKSKQVWRIEIGKVGEDCMITCNGEPVYASVADLHMEPGVPTTLHLKFPVYGPAGAMFQWNDEVMAEGQPMFTTIEIGEHHYWLKEITKGEMENGLFWQRRAKGDAHQSL